MKLQVPADGLDLGGFLPYRLSVLTNRVSRTLARTYASRFGLSVPEWRVMAVLGQRPGASADEVCRRTEMDKVTVSRAIARLRQRGLVHRATAPDDRRRSVLALTGRGAGVYRRIVPLAREYERRLLAVLNEAERADLDRLLDKLTRQAGRLRDEDGSIEARPALARSA